MFAWLKRVAVNAFLRRFFKPHWVRPGLTVADVRQQGDRLVKHFSSGDGLPGRVEPVPGGTQGEWFGVAAGDARRVILYLHGGAFVMYPRPLYRAFAARLVRHTGAQVFLVDYRLAPEHRHPAASDDCLAAYRHLLDSGIDPAGIVVAGDSAGGNLALVTLLRARDAGLPMAACAFLLSPVTDFLFSGASVLQNAARDVTFSLGAEYFVRGHYLADPMQITQPWVSPLFAALHGLPPLLLQVGDTEMLLDDSRRLADRVSAEGGQAELRVFHDVPHCFQVSPLLREAKPAIDDIAAFVQRHLRGADSAARPAAAAKSKAVNA